jgi:hypothetical protein
MSHASDLAVRRKESEIMLLTSLLDVKHDDVILASDLAVRRKAR